MPLSDWKGAVEKTLVELKAVGPGSASWSVSYDNVRNVFGFYDKGLSADAKTETPYYYTYMIVGWYFDPEDDLLYNIATDKETDWENALEDTYEWTLNEDHRTVADAVADWKTWQKANGLTGTIDPSLPDQIKTAMTDWLSWQTKYGNKDDQPDYARQILCHSMIANVKWVGPNTTYGSGMPLLPGVYPDVAIGNNSVEAISIYMSNRVLHSDPQDKPTDEDIMILARAMDAFQYDQLSQYGSDPIKVENRLHDARFTNATAGKEWIVVRQESDSDSPSTEAGRQSIPLNETETKALSHLNDLQQEANILANTILSQRNELFMLYWKLLDIKNTNTFPPCVKEKTTDSYVAIANVLNENLKRYEVLTAESSTEADNIIYNKTQFQSSIGTGYIVQSADLTGFSMPNDPVIMIAGTNLDTKMSSDTMDLNSKKLSVRYTGQFLNSIDIAFTINGAATTETIGATELLSKVTFSKWNAFPKEVMDLRVESLLMDHSNAALIAVAYFDKRGVSSADYNKVAASGKTYLEELTDQIQNAQGVIWNSTDELEITRQSLVEVVGFNGIAPAHAAVAFRDKQPWTPIFMDWMVKWVPNSKDSATPFEDWELGELDYNWSGKSLPTENTKLFSGRALLNPYVAQNIQLKLNGYKDDPSFDDLPQFVRDDLKLAANQIKKIDILTQSISGFTEELITKKINPGLTPKNDEISSLLGGRSVPPVETLLGGANENYIPVRGVDASDCPCNSPADPPPPQTYSPIRSGHFQLYNVWVIDSFGQILKGRDFPSGKVPNSPMENVFWSESLKTPGATLEKGNGQLPPRLSQPVKASLNLLQSDNNKIFSNSSDATSPICGWVMPNHLDNSLMVFDAGGNNKGAVIRVASEETTTGASIRWDAAPGLDTTLGAPPDLTNTHLKGFVNGLLKTGFEGDKAYSNFMSAIDSALWTMSSYGSNNGNMALLLGRPLAVVRAQVMLQVSGMPAYNQSWCDTGKYYNKSGVYNPTQPPFMSADFSLRVGDAYLVENGVMGYFQSDHYDVFYPVYGADGQTQTIIEIIRAGNSLNFVPVPGGGYDSTYIKSGHLIPVTPNGKPIYLTLLVDPVAAFR